MMAPDHVGFIMDGNRRFAKRLMEKPWKGHEWGAEKLKEVLEWCKDNGITEVTLYAFSLQNQNRPDSEFDFLMQLFHEFADELEDSEEYQDNEHGVQIRVIGRKDIFPEDVQERMRRIEEHTQDNEEYRLNVAAGYGGRDEITTAARRLVQQAEDGELTTDEVDSETVEDELYLASEPDLVVRTGGERRTSNFLPWQSVYAEWIFVDSMWPEFDEEDFETCLEEYAERERRFGR